MERMGEITSVQGEWLEITFCRPADCEKCHACHGGPKEMHLRVRGEGNVGDIAVIEMPERTLSRAALLAYALPLAGFIGGLLLGSALFPDGSLGGVIGGLAGLALPLAYLRLSEARRSQDPAWQPQLVRVIARQENIDAP